MTEQDRVEANSFIDEYIKRKTATHDWEPTAKGLMRVAYGAACEVKNKRIAELESDIERINLSLNGG